MSLLIPVMPYVSRFWESVRLNGNIHQGYTLWASAMVSAIKVRWAHYSSMSAFTCNRIDAINACKSSLSVVTSVHLV